MKTVRFNETIEIYEYYPLSSIENITFYVKIKKRFQDFFKKIF